MDDIRDWEGETGIEIRGWQSRDEINKTIKIMLFSDLIFKKHPIGEGFQAILELRDNKTLSVVAFEGAYCTPKKNLLSLEKYSSFEVAIMDDVRDWEAETGVEIRGWQSRDEITEIINQLR